MRRTKIVCTLGPASRRTSMLRAMIRAGMNVARINFSHGTHAEHRATIHRIRKVSAEENAPIAILADLAGPKFRLETVQKGAALREGGLVRLVNRSIVGTDKQLSVNRPDLLPALLKGHRVMIWDGKLQMEVIEPGHEEVTCRVIAGGPLKDRAGVNMPDSVLDIPPLTQKDLKDIAFGVKENVDFFGFSFVRSAADIVYCQNEIRARKGQTPIIAKMEMREAVKNLEEIIDAADGVMVARGDLGIEIPLENVPRVQKQIIAYSNQQGKPVITATEMLLSMVTAARPTRAEAGDVANAILDGTDAVMLSEETAVGEHPDAVTRMMARIAHVAEESIFETSQVRLRRPRLESHDLGRSIAHSAVLLADQLDAAVIIAPTDSGDTPRRIVRHRPEQLVLALSTSDQAVRRLNLSWGVIPWKLAHRLPPEKILEHVRARLLEEELAAEGHYAVMCAGYPFGADVSRGRVILTEVI
ncbi:MAG: pyruvate kinase [bacterium]|nr:pyruvate kinase [bacterium]